MYPDPWTFNPDRYDASSTVDGAMNMDPRKVMFGFGRRQCAGMHLAGSRLLFVPYRDP
jgi:cytochrome P450